MVKEEIKSIVEETKELIMRQNFTHAMQRISEGLEIAESDEDFAALYAVRGMANYFQHMPTMALEDLRTARSYAEKTANDELRSNIREDVVYLENYINKLKAYISSEEERLEKEKDERERGIILSELGTLYYYMGRRDAAREKFIQALQIFERIGEDLAVAATYVNLGNSTDGIEAIDYFYRALDILEREGHLHGIADVYESLALFYWREEKWEEAYYFLKKEIEVVEEIEKVEGKEEIIRKYGDVYRMAADIATILGREDECLKFMEKLGS